MVIHGSLITRDIIILYVCTVHFLLRIRSNCLKLFNKINKRVTVYIALVKLPCFFFTIFLFCSKCSKHFGIGYLSLVFICRENPRQSGFYFLPTIPDFADILDNRQKSVPDSRETPCLFVIGGLEPSNLGDW